MGRPKGSKNKTKKRTATSSRSRKNTYDAPMMSDEVAIIITFAVSAFLFLSNLGLCGPIGAFLKGLQLGLFGVVGYIFPIVLSFVVVFMLSNLDNPYATFRMTTALFMLIFISAFLQLAFGEVAQMGLADFYKEGAVYGTGGGAIGGALGMFHLSHLYHRQTSCKNACRTVRASCHQGKRQGKGKLERCCSLRPHAQRRKTSCQGSAAARTCS